MKKILPKLSIAASSAVATLPFASSLASAQLLPEPSELEGAGFFADFSGVVRTALTAVMIIAALLVLMYLVWGGIQWITSGGDKGKTEEARNKITSAVIGLIVVAASYAVFQLVLGFLNVDINELFSSISN